ncbi:hypothetical protein BV20DRAFT_469167 [Pilatotrama ljubarskyi]|nr:hypothetical protein BV20DRAFT_469167 [Pilatotrama ljubarskyi]
MSEIASRGRGFQLTRCRGTLQVGTASAPDECFCACGRPWGAPTMCFSLTYAVCYSWLTSSFDVAPACGGRGR